MSIKNLKSEPIRVSKKFAKQFILSHHFLLPPKELASAEIVSHLFPHLGCIQFDTINVVGRNADLVLQSRVKGYQPAILEKLLYEDRVLLDGWDKVASIYRTEDWPYFERHRKFMGDQHHRRSNAASKTTPELLKKIQTDGPVSSLDFKDEPKTDWSWGPTSVTRAGLEILFAEGKLGIHHRVNTRRHFDLVERLIPREIFNTPDPNLTEKEYHDWHVLRRIGSQGIASPRSGEHWLGIYQLKKAAERKKVVRRLLEKQELAIVEVEGLENQEFYVRAQDLEGFEAPPINHSPSKAAFIAPLDNLLWNRKLIHDLFDFSYTWEVYKPKAKREYGYYVLPVLLGEEFIARVDMKYDRKTSTLLLNNWWWEPKISKDTHTQSAVLECMDEFLHYLGAEKFNLSSEAENSREMIKIFKPHL